MGKLLPTILDTRYEKILKEERSLAKDISSAIIKLRPLSAWDVTIPLVFIISLIKHKRTKEIFTLNFLFTKKLALEAARDMVGKEQTKEEAMERIKVLEDSVRMDNNDKESIVAYMMNDAEIPDLELEGCLLPATLPPAGLPPVLSSHTSQSLASERSMSKEAKLTKLSQSSKAGLGIVIARWRKWL